jgi:hypothetical protein
VRIKPETVTVNKMKKIIYILVFILPVICSAQQSLYKSSPLDYMWMNVGNAGFTQDMVALTRIAFNSYGEPCVAFSDYGNGMKASVMRFNGSIWLNVGNEGFSAGQANSTSLSFDPDGVPFVGFSDDGYERKAVVMKYDSLYVGINHIRNSPLTVYPDPASGSITIYIKSVPGTLHYFEIDNAKGIRMFETENFDSKTVADVGNYPAGIYIVKVNTENSIWIGKFCKD